MGAKKLKKYVMSASLKSFVKENFVGGELSSAFKTLMKTKLEPGETTEISYPTHIKFDNFLSSTSSSIKIKLTIGGVIIGVSAQVQISMVADVKFPKDLDENDVTWDNISIGSLKDDEKREVVKLDAKIFKKIDSDIHIKEEEEYRKHMQAVRGIDPTE